MNILPKEYQILDRHISMGDSVGTVSRFDKDTISVVFYRGRNSLKLRYLLKWDGRGKVWHFQ
jgi:hypothetical protein